MIHISTDSILFLSLVVRSFILKPIVVAAEYPNTPESDFQSTQMNVK